MMAPLFKPGCNSSRPHWTAPVSREETLAIREKLRQVGWRPPDYKHNTNKCINQAMRLWVRYCQHLGSDPEQHLLEGGPADFESWIDWILRTTKKKSHETIKQYWKWLCQGYSVLARRPMDSFKLEQVRRYINGQMHEDHVVSRRVRQKDTLSAENLGILLRWHWKYDMACYPNERQRVQMSLLMLFSAFTGSQPGTILAGEDGSSNEFTYERMSELVSHMKDGSTENSAASTTESAFTDSCDGETLVNDGCEYPRRYR